MHPTKLQEDRKDYAERIRQRGWRLDSDMWWIRYRRKGDIEVDQCHFGFTTKHRVYVRSARYALAYDRGEVIPFKA